MKLIIRPEGDADHSAIKALYDLAFGNCNEGMLVERLRKTRAFRPDLSLAAVSSGRTVGHILLYPVAIRGGDLAHSSLSLSPMCVHPAYQRSGIGSALAREGLTRAKAAGYGSVVVLGHPEFYKRFGFVSARDLGIRTPFNVSGDLFFALELARRALDGVRGVVEYPEQFLVTV